MYIPSLRYKVCTGKPANTFGFDGECKDAAYAEGVIDETHRFWKKMIKTRRASVGGVVPDARSAEAPEAAPAAEEAAPAEAAPDAA